MCISFILHGSFYNFIEKSMSDPVKMAETRFKVSSFSLQWKVGTVHCKDNNQSWQTNVANSGEQPPSQFLNIKVLLPSFGSKYLSVYAFVCLYFCIHWLSLFLILVAVDMFVRLYFTVWEGVCVCVCVGVKMLVYDYLNLIDTIHIRFGVKICNQGVYDLDLKGANLYCPYLGAPKNLPLLQSLHIESGKWDSKIVKIKMLVRE